MSETIESTAREELIRVENLSYFEEEQALLSSLSFSFSKGGVHGILGPRGSGKALLLRILAGCEMPSEGYVTVHGQDPADPRSSIRKKIGFVPAHPSFYRDMSVSEVLDFVGEARDVPTDKRYRQIKEALSLLEIEDLKNRLVSRLSVTELKLLSLAASLLGNPEVVLLDDPFPRKKPELSARLMRLIPMLGRVKTVVLSGSDFPTIRALCEDVVILSDGRLLAEGSFEALEHQLKKRGEAASLESVYASLTPTVCRKEDLV